MKYKFAFKTLGCKLNFTESSMIAEEFINNGYVDMYKAMKIYNKYCYEGVFMDDHCPLIDNDIDFPGNWGGYRSRIFAQGYIQAMIESVKKS